MQSKDIRNRFLDFFKKRGHTVVPSSSLIPDDPSVLLTTAGMQQFKPYYTETKSPYGKNVASCQKCFRTSDIDEVGDDSHLTFFEMLGNFSFGGYFKKEAIEYAYEFITKELGLEISFVTVFEGSEAVPKDEESKKIWNSLGVQNIKEQGMDDVFWGPTGKSGPCGPTTEVYCRNANGDDIEVWNIVFNEFFCNGSREDLISGKAKLEPLKEKGIDTGLGLERIAMIKQGEKNIFETDLFVPILNKIYKGIDVEIRRIIVDHARAIVFLISDGVRPSNKEAGYILRRLLRRIIAYAYRFNIGAPPQELFDLIKSQYDTFKDYSNLDVIVVKEIFQDEYDKFIKTIESGLREFYKIYPEAKFPDTKKGEGYRFHHVKRITGKDAFNLYQTYGLTVDILKDLAKDAGHFVDEKEFNLQFKKHQEISRAGVEKKFGGHGLILDTGELKASNEEELQKVIRLHTASHLLNAALHKVLGDEVSQRGSDITPERTRFDFAFSRKMTSEEIKQVEDLVNGAIAKDYKVTEEIMPLEQAKQSGALFFYKGHYPEKVKVYTIGNGQETFSKELCGGPHVSKTGEIGKFKITKEESSSAGVRRIRAVAS